MGHRRKSDFDGNRITFSYGYKCERYGGTSHNPVTVTILQDLGCEFDLTELQRTVGPWWRDALYRVPSSSVTFH